MNKIVYRIDHKDRAISKDNLLNDHWLKVIEIIRHIVTTGQIL